MLYEPISYTYVDTVYALDHLRDIVNKENRKGNVLTTQKIQQYLDSLHRKHPGKKEGYIIEHTYCLKEKSGLEEKKTYYVLVDLGMAIINMQADRNLLMVKE